VAWAKWYGEDIVKEALHLPDDEVFTLAYVLFLEGFTLFFRLCIGYQDPETPLKTQPRFPVVHKYYE
jgi:hypothetical protein